MRRLSKVGITFLLSFLFMIIFAGLSEVKAEASEVPLPSEYYFEFNGVKKTGAQTYQMKLPEVLVTVKSDNWSPDTQVTWISSAPGIVEVRDTSYGDQIKQLVRHRPGYSTITALIKHGSNTYTLSCSVEVELTFDYQKTGLTTATTTNERILVLNTIGQERQVYIKYADDDISAVSGAAIDATYVTWESQNPGVATVDDNGLVKAVGSGSTTITVTSNTMSASDKPMVITMKVVVAPLFNLTFDETDGFDSVSDTKDPKGIATGVPSNFVISSKATLATNLKWEVYDVSGTTKKKLPEGSSSKMTYTVSEISGNVSFEGVKAGTYEIYAFADSKFNVNTNAPYAYLKIIVPIDIRDRNIVMTVGDTYSILENSNITGVGVFGAPTYIVGNSNIARLDTTNYVITAKKKGKVTIRLEYNTALGLFDDEVPAFDINITVIDGIALNMTSAAIFTNSTLLLDALVTDPTIPIVWSSSDPTIAKVEDGLVTGLKQGTTIITAKQTINGIVKKATCEITVQQSVATITIEPATVTLAIGGYTTLHATITPKNLSGVKLQWKSSNENIVKVVESSALTATIQGVAGGHAVISAINQDNVVVGYCHVSVQQPVTSIVLSESSATLNLKTKRIQLRATVNPENALNKTINWSSTDTSKATVDQNGIVTLLKPGTVTIIATSADNPSVVAYCNINIEIPVASVTLDSTEKTMYVGQSERLTYVILPTNASNNSVTWTSTNTSVATVDSTGKVSAKNPGTTVIILRTLDGGFSVYCTVKVKSVATGIKFDVSSLNLKTGDYYIIKTTLTPKNSTENSLVWESSDTKVAIVDTEGKVTAKGAGTAIIMARTEAGAIAYCKVLVTQAVEGLILNFTEKTIYKGEEFKIEVSVTPSSATKLDVTWKSSNTSVATVNSEGKVTGLKGGIAIISCTTVDGGFVERCIVTVRETVTKITLNYDTYDLGINKTFTLIATVTTESATNQNVTWKSSNTKVATVNKNGKVTGISLGYATITAIAQDGSEVEATCEIRVVTPVSGITLDKSYITMYIGDSKTLKATIRPNNSTYKKAKWTSGDETIAIVDEDGVVTALKEGSTTIVAEAQDSSGKKAICYVTVLKRQPATGVTLADKSLVMVPGEEKTVRVVLNPTTSTDGVSWSTDNASVAKVDKKTGKIKALSPGTATITVITDSGKTAIIDIMVVGLNVTEIVAEQYTTYDNALEVEGYTGNVTYRIDNPNIAVVYRNGTISTRGAGTATITATVNGRKLTCKLIVKPMK